jgi:hypothetical protein
MADNVARQPKGLVWALVVLLVGLLLLLSWIFQFPWGWQWQ